MSDEISIGDTITAPQAREPVQGKVLEIISSHSGPVYLVEGFPYLVPARLARKVTADLAPPEWKAGMRALVEIPGNNGADPVEIVAIIDTGEGGHAPFAMVRRASGHRYAAPLKSLRKEEA